MTVITPKHGCGLHHLPSQRRDCTMMPTIHGGLRGRPSGSAINGTTRRFYRCKFISLSISILIIFDIRLLSTLIVVVVLGQPAAGLGWRAGSHGAIVRSAVGHGRGGRHAVVRRSALRGRAAALRGPPTTRVAGRAVPPGLLCLPASLSCLFFGSILLGTRSVDEGHKR